MRLQFGVIIGIVVAGQALAQGSCYRESERQSRNGAAGRLDFLSSNSMHITATRSGHEIHLYQRALVVQTLVPAVAAVRNRVPLSSPKFRDER